METLRCGCKVRMNMSMVPTSEGTMCRFIDEHNPVLFVTPTNVVKHRSHSVAQKKEDVRQLVQQLK